jgi:hypothetical protein
MGVCHFRSSLSFLWCYRAFVLLSWCICNMNTCCSRFSASVASRMQFPKMYDVAGCVFVRVHCSVLCDLPHFMRLGLCAQYPLVCNYAWHLLHCGELAQFGLSYFVGIANVP